ncbi:MAG: GntR family transcriptional regulator [Victivallales bacterium]
MIDEIMKNMRIERPISIRQQICEHLRQAILKGDFAPGQKLPSTKSLSEQYGTQVANIHAAMSILVKEGLLARGVGIGTSVNKRQRPASDIAVYIKSDFSRPMANYMCLLMKMLEEQLKNRGIVIHLLQDNLRNGAFHRLCRLAEDRSIQGVIFPALDSKILEKAKKMIRVPWAAVTSAKIINRVCPHQKSLVKLAIDGLLQAGCRRVGVLASVARKEKSSDNRGGARDFFRDLLALAESSGIEMPPELTVSAHSWDIPDFNVFAYNGIDAIWNRKDKPDGLFIYTDDLLPGALMGIMKNRIDVPKNLKLVTHHNKELPLLCPVPAFLIENSVGDVAAGLIKIIENQLSGRQVSPVEFDFTLREHKENATEGKTFTESWSYKETRQ